MKSEDWPTVGDNIADANANGAITPPTPLISPTTVPDSMKNTTTQGIITSPAANVSPVTVPNPMNGIAAQVDITPRPSEPCTAVPDAMEETRAQDAITPPGSLSSPPKTEGERQDQTETSKGPSSSILRPSQCSSSAASGFPHAFDKRFRSMVEERAVREGRVEGKERGKERRLSGSREKEEA